MDGISAAASIIGIATAGAQISIKLITLADQVRTASDRVTAVANDVALTSAVLQQLGDFMNPKPDDGINVLNQSGIQTINASARTCERIFEKLKNEIKKASVQFSHAIQVSPREQLTLSRLEKAKWPFLQSSMETLRIDLREAKGTLTLILQVASLAYTKKVAASNSKLSRPITMETQDDLIRTIRTLSQQHPGLLKSNGLGIGNSGSIQDKNSNRETTNMDGLHDAGANGIAQTKSSSDHDLNNAVADLSENVEENGNGKETLGTSSYNNESPGKNSGATITAGFSIAPTMRALQALKLPEDTNTAASSEEPVVEVIKSERFGRGDPTNDEAGILDDSSPKNMSPLSTKTSSHSATGSPFTNANSGANQKIPRTIWKSFKRLKSRGVAENNSMKRPWNGLSLWWNRQSKDESGAIRRLFEVNYLKPYVLELGNDVVIRWILHSYLVSGKEDLQMVDGLRGKSSWPQLTQQLISLSVEEERRVYDFIAKLPPGDELFSMQRTRHDIEYKGMTIRNVPKYCFVVALDQNTNPSLPHNSETIIRRTALPGVMNQPLQVNDELVPSHDEPPQIEAPPSPPLEPLWIHGGRPPVQIGYPDQRRVEYDSLHRRHNYNHPPPPFPLIQPNRGPPHVPEDAPQAIYPEPYRQTGYERPPKILGFLPDDDDDDLDDSLNLHLPSSGQGPPYDSTHPRSVPYVKAHRKYLSPVTLDAFGLPWEWDEKDPNYLIVKQWIPEHRRDMLFEHSRRWVEHNKKWHTGKLQIGIGEELKSEREQLLSHQAFLDNSINHTNRLPRPSPPLSGAISIARPTFIKVNRKYLEPETLDTYAIEWESDDRDPTYIIIKQWVSEIEQDVLFEHTRRLREKKQLVGTQTLLKKERNQLLLARKEKSMNESDQADKGKAKEHNADDDTMDTGPTSPQHEQSTASKYGRERPYERDAGELPIFRQDPASVLDEGWAIKSLPTMQSGSARSTRDPRIIINNENTAFIDSEDEERKESGEELPPLGPQRGRRSSRPYNDAPGDDIVNELLARFTTAFEENEEREEVFRFRV